MAEPQSQSVRMHTRSQGFQPAGPGGGVSDNSAPGGGVTDQPQLEIGERLSVMAQFQAKPNQKCLLQCQIYLNQ